MEIEKLMKRDLTQDEFEFEYTWESDKPIKIRCVMEYTPEERGGFAHPDYPAECSLVACFVEGDISELLNMKQIGIIESSSLRWLKHKQEENKDGSF